MIANSKQKKFSPLAKTFFIFYNMKIILKFFPVIQEQFHFSYISLLFSIAFASVTSSVYSKSPPIGIP